MTDDVSNAEGSEQFEWGYAENVHCTCPECGSEVALETDKHEFGGARCVNCDTRMECELR